MEYSSLSRRLVVALLGCALFMHPGVHANKILDMAKENKYRTTAITAVTVVSVAWEVYKHMQSGETFSSALHKVTSLITKPFKSPTEGIVFKAGFALLITDVLASLGISGARAYQARQLSPEDQVTADEITKGLKAERDGEQTLLNEAKEARAKLPENASKEEIAAADAIVKTQEGKVASLDQRIKQVEGHKFDGLTLQLFRRVENLDKSVAELSIKNASLKAICAKTFKKRLFGEDFETKLAKYEERAREAKTQAERDKIVAELLKEHELALDQQA